MKTITITNGAWFDSLKDVVAQRHIFRVAIDNGWTIRAKGQKWLCLANLLRPKSRANAPIAMGQAPSRNGQRTVTVKTFHMTLPVPYAMVQAKPPLPNRKDNRMAHKDKEPKEPSIQSSLYDVLQHFNMSMKQACDALIRLLEKKGKGNEPE